VTESELIDKIKDQPACFSEVFKLYYNSIFGYIFRRTGNFDEAADISANTFLKAFLHIKNFSYHGISLKVWLYRIATNELNQYFRWQKRYNSFFLRFDSSNQELIKEYLVHDKDQLEQELLKHEQFVQILKILKTLPVQYQEVISLRYFEGKDIKEISQILNIREGTIKSLLSRGLEKIRKKCNPI
jgi:RNA polymerase sigma-70 factor, ECF subfamily